MKGRVNAGFEDLIRTMDEMRYRQHSRLTCVMHRLTVAIFVLTGIVTVATLYNVFWKEESPTHVAPV